MYEPSPLMPSPPPTQPADDTRIRRIRRGDPVRYTGQRVCGLRGCMTRHVGSNTGYVTRTYWFGRWSRVRWTLGVPTVVRTSDLIRIFL